MGKKQEYEIILKDKFNKNLKKADNTTKSFNSTISKSAGLMKGLLPVAGVAAFGIAFKKVVEISSRFEKEMSEVKAVSGATESQFKALNQQAESLGKSTVFSAQQAAEGMKFLSMAGFEVKDTMKALPGVLDLAAAGTIGLGKAADIASNILTQYGLSADSMNRVNDVITATTTRTNTNIEQLAEGLKYTGTTAKILKMPLEETSAALGVLANAGLQGSMGGTSLNFALLEMSRISSPTAKKIKKLGVATHDANGDFVGLTNILEQFEKQGIQSTTILDTFGARGGRAMGTLVEAGSDAIKTFTELNKSSQGIAKRIAKMKLDNLAGDMTLLSSASQGFAITLGKRLNPAMRKITQQTTKLIGKFDDMISVPVSETLKKEKFEFNALINVLKRSNTSVQARQKAIDTLNTKYKEYLPSLIKEKTTEEELNRIREEGNKKILERIKIQARRELIQQQEKNMNSFIQKVIEAEIKIGELHEMLKTARKGTAVSAFGGVQQGEFEATEGAIELIERRIGKLNDKIAERQSMINKIMSTGVTATEAGSTLKAAGVSVGLTPDASAKKLTSTITSAAPKVININIAKLIET
ncbi:MAG TPA: phage tail tape measure protein, partial [Candidatus Thioglobus autotrophicus]|nr:phage tail tape measure protein [Candidatus Thioglobus autotrophicus]